MILPTIIAASATASTMLYFARKERRHVARMQQLDYNIHVNGIRGKSTVTRMLGGVLREAEVPTISKTTGTYACVIDADATEHPIKRTGPANINEQYKFLEQWLTQHNGARHSRHDRAEIRGLVVECMAVRPKYQNICQNVILRSPLTVITNVRLDHQEEMGDTLEEIAESLCNTVPDHGTVITAERDPKIIDVMRRITHQRGSKLIVAEYSELAASLVDKFSYHQFEENVALVLAVADYLNIDRDVAIRGMIAAEPDPGTTQVTRLTREDGSNLHWVPMFAVNDWESTTRVFRSVRDTSLAEECRKVLALNNRADRTDRAAMFVDVVTQDLVGEFDRVVLYGDIQEAVRSKLIESGLDESMVYTTSDIEDHEGAELLDYATQGYEGEDVAVFGMVNIHTDQVTAMRRHVSALLEGSLMQDTLLDEMSYADKSADCVEANSASMHSLEAQGVDAEADTTTFASLR